jgi:Do/DeqQ family serine protease
MKHSISRATVALLLDGRTALQALALIVALPACTFAAALPFAVDGKALPSLAPMLARATPAVVNIAARGTVAVRPDPFFSDPFFQRFFNVPQRRRQREIRSVGSGVIIDAERGLVVTNHHVIANTKEIAVTLRDGTTLEAILVGSDPATDLAVLKVPPGGLTELKFADSAQLRVGDFVIAIGNPFGLGQAVTSGIVSALGRGGLGLGDYENFIQTDAAINSGNSGGALVNLRGDLVGINSQIVSRRGGGSIGIGFAIPTNMVRDIVAQLVMHGGVRRGLLGVAAQDLTAELAEAFGLPSQRRGAVIVEIQRDSSAELAGLLPGDVVVGVNDRPVRRSQELTNALGVLAVGDSVNVHILRDRQERTIAAKIGENVPQKRVAAPTLAQRLSGAQFVDFNRQQVPEAQGNGVLVLEVDSGSAAWRYGLRKGDVVVAVNRKPVASLAELEHAVSASGRALMLKTQRGRGSVFILIQ